MRVARTFTAAAVVLSVASCTSGAATSTNPSGSVVDRSSAPQTSSLPATSVASDGSSSTTKPTIVVTAKTAVDPALADAYQLAVRSEFEASASSDANSQMLAATHLDPLLQRLKDRLVGRNLEGQASKRPGDTKSQTTILEAKVDGESASVVECTVDDATVYVAATGKVVNDKVATLKRTATMRKDGELWKVADRVNNQEWEGVAGCASS